MAFTVCVAWILAGCGLTGSERLSISAEHAREIGMPPISFHFDYSKQLKKSVGVKAGKESYYVSLAARTGTRMREEVWVGYLRAQAGRVSAVDLPIVMERYKQLAERRYPGYRFLQEGWTKVGPMRAYQLFFTARARPGLGNSEEQEGKVQARLILLPRPGLTGGVAITLIAGKAAGFERATQIGVKGHGAKVLESFGFGA